MKNEIQAGTILISKPFMEDKRFEKTIILIVEHNQNGTIGFVLNKETLVNIDEIIPEYDVVFSNDDFTHELYDKRGKSIISVDLKSRSDLSGTNIRNLILTDQNWKQFLPSGTVEVLTQIDAKKRLEDL